MTDRAEAAELIEPTCPCCREHGVFAFRTGDRFYAATDVEVDLYRCKVCKSLFQHPLPNRQTIAGFYPTGYWGEQRKPSLMSWLQSLYIGIMLRLDPMSWIRRLKLKRGNSLLDLGCSRGDWLNLIRRKKLEVTGLESDPRAVAYARETYNLDVEESEVEGWMPTPSRYHAISAFHLMEHLPEPGVFLTKCRTSLKTNGLLLLRVPNVASWQAQQLGQRWKGLEMPRHLIMFNPESLVGLLRAYGFAPVNISTWSLRDGPATGASSLFPVGEPTRQQILGKSRPFATLLYLGLTGLIAPIEFLSSMFGRGAIITVIARKL